MMTQETEINLFDCLPHAFDSIQVLNKRYLNKRNRINTWSTHSVDRKSKKANADGMY